MEASRRHPLIKVTENNCFFVVEALVVEDLLYANFRNFIKQVCLLRLRIVVRPTNYPKGGTRQGVWWPVVT